MGKRMLSLCMALALCLGLLPATALAAGEDSWEHTSHDGSWTALTAETLEEKKYTLQDGNYCFSGTSDGWGEVLTTTKQLTITGTVTLCLNNTRYTYEGEADAAIVVGEGANLTICCCQGDEWGNYDGMISNSNVSYGIYNNGTLTVTGGGIAINKENGAAIYNAGTCTISGGSMSGTAGAWGNYKTAYGIFNAKDASLSISGSPSISGRAVGDMNDPSGPQIDILTYDTIQVQDLSSDIWKIHIGYYGEASQAVVNGVNNSTSQCFDLTYPENAEFIYNETAGTLTYAGHTSLTYGDTNVMGNTYYKVNESGSGLEEGTEADYDILWDEDGKTLTLNSVTIETQINSFTFAEGLFSAAVEEGITVELIGENSITVSSHAHGVDKDAYAIKNKAGGITLQGEGSLAITMRRGATSGDQDIVGIQAAGAVNNQTTLSVSGDKGNLGTWSGMTGIACASFTNTGTFTADISDASTARALSTGDFANSGTLDVDFTDVDNGVGVLLTGDGSGFTNSGEMDIDIPAAGRAQGILRYSASGEAAEDNFTWTNTADGSITIQVGNQGAATAALGGGSLAGLDLRSDGDITFTNKGDLTVDATSDEPANLSQTNWPSWQYFDTIALGLMPGGTGTVTNTGSMTLAAYNGYTAGLYVAGVEDTVSITNSGELNITTTTKGGDNIRSVGLYAQLMQITETEAQQLPFDTTGGKVTISTTAAEGSQVDSDKLMAICLVQTFTGTAPAATDDFQQIEEEGIALSGEPVVLDPVTTTITTSGGEITQTHIINTIGTVNADGTVTPSTGMTALPALTGNVTIEGNPQVGDTLTAQVSGLPGGVTVAYQWQSADSQSGPFTAIDGATGESYTLTNSELGKYIRVVVTPTGDSYGGTLTATTSQPVARPYSPPANPNYKITVQPTENGAVTAPTSAKQGTEVTLTPTPDEGFDVGTVTVTDRFGDAVEVTENPDGTYTFTMPNGQVTVEVTFVESQPEPLPFTDVAESDWFYDAVRYAYENGLMGGIGDNLFAPNHPTTRAQLVTILYRLEGEPAVTGQSGFTDVEPDTWYTDAVTWAAEEGVVNGVSETQFAPGNNITREQLATILFRYAQAKGYDVSPRADLSGFPDAGDILPYAQEAMAWAVAEGLLQGFEDDTLRPQGNATRAQIATILMRFCEGVVE